MKLIPLIFFLFLYGSSFSQRYHMMKIQDSDYRGTDKIQGDWILDSIQLKDQLFIPKERYLLHVQDSTIKFNTTTNQCWFGIELLNDSMILSKGIGCTLVGADLHGDKLKYSGKYKIKDSLYLRINNNLGSYFLSRYLVKKER